MTETLGTLLLSWLAADLMAGIFHWAEDRYFRPHWLLVGEWIAKPNELHHAQPRAFLEHSYWARNWTTLIPAGLAALLAWLFTAPAWLTLAFLFVSQANEVHAWAHRKGDVCKPVAVLQASGLLQSPKHHGQHHRDPFDRNYCVMSDWLNPILEAIGFWTLLEWILARMGVHPK